MIPDCKNYYVVTLVDRGPDSARQAVCQVEMQCQPNCEHDTPYDVCCTASKTKAANMVAAFEALGASATVRCEDACP
jgi:hypothetical protein